MRVIVGQWVLISHRAMADDHRSAWQLGLAGDCLGSSKTPTFARGALEEALGLREVGDLHVLAIP